MILRALNMDSLHLIFNPKFSVVAISICRIHIYDFIFPIKKGNNLYVFRHIDIHDFNYKIFS